MKINGRLGDSELNKALGNTTKILDCSGAVDYACKIAKMDVDSLYRHGMAQYGIRPNNRIKGRPSFEKRCVDAFRKEIGQKITEVGQRKKLTKKKQAELEKILAKGK
tara:strand:- start:27 stop:347 length:321 start_codon:yes stop_codon:yes gene_type:complete